MAKVSIIIPTHDRPELLTERAIPSVLRQETDHEIELLVVGDDTDAKTVSLMEALVKEDSRISFWNLPRQVLPEDAKTAWLVIGLEARNFGHDHATGDYVGGLDDDDEFTRDHVQVLVDAIVENDVDFAYGKSIAYKSDGRIQHYGHWPPGYGAFCDGAAIWKRSLGYRYDPECVSRGMAEDGDLWTRMWDDGVRFTFVPTVVHHYYPAKGGGSDT
jgi:glycosyltransferase involved in cell wall biosynthesis